MAREHNTTADTYLVTWTVEPGEVGRRLDHFLKEKYRKLSREYLQRCIKNGRVTLNHKTSKPGQQLRLNDKVYVLSTRSTEPEVDFNYKILYEDEHLLVVDKPGNLPVHPTGRFFFHTLLTQLRVNNGNEVDQEKEFFIVHRIDRETSGILAIGKTKEAAADLVKQFENRVPKKEYLAIVKGEVEKDSFIVDVPLAQDQRAEIKLKMHVVEMGAKGEPLYINKSEVLNAETHFEVVERLNGFTLVRCKPHTGRQHQIRVHLHHVGHTIIGDKLYGTEAEFFLASLKEITSIQVAPGLSLSRHALHASKLKLQHPITKKEMEFVSELPRELDEFLQKVRR